MSRVAGHSAVSRVARHSAVSRVELSRVELSRVARHSAVSRVELSLADTVVILVNTSSYVTQSLTVWAGIALTAF